MIGISSNQATYSHVGKNGASKTITLTGGDGVEPWSTAHTREDGGTNMNNVVYDGTTYSLLSILYKSVIYNLS